MTTTKPSSPSSSSSSPTTSSSSSSSSSDSSSSSSILSTKTAELDGPLNAIGFEIDELTPSLVSGHLLVTPKCCQPFKVLHGGVSALIGEALASIGAFLACGMNRVAGVHLSIDHMKSAPLGELIYAQATPLSSGRTIQVWEVRLWKVDKKTMKNGQMISSSRVTLLCNLPVPNHLKEAIQPFKKYAKL